MKWSDDLYGNNDHILMTLPPPEFPADPTKPSEQDPCEDVQESRETRRRGSFYLLLVLVLFLPPPCHGYNQGVGGGHRSGRGGHRHRRRGEKGGG